MDAEDQGRTKKWETGGMASVKPLEDTRIALISENWPLFCYICSSRSLTTVGKGKKKLARIPAPQCELGLPI